MQQDKAPVPGALSLLQATDATAVVRRAVDKPE
jgi:hypothetical protein